MHFNALPLDYILIFLIFATKSNSVYNLKGGEIMKSDATNSEGGSRICRDIGLLSL